MSRLILTALLILTVGASVRADDFLDDIPATSSRLDGYNRDRVTKRLSEMPLHNIEGLWQWVDDGAIIAIERAKTIEAVTTYRMVVIESPHRSIRPGTVMGYLTTTAKQDNFDARIYTDNNLNGLLHSSKSFNIVMSDNSRLAITPYREGISVSLWRWIPYMYRIGISTRGNRPQGLDGCIKIFPLPATRPLNPRYL